MTHRNIFSSLLLMAVLCSCGNSSTENTVEAESASASDAERSTKNSITFKVDGAEVKTTGHNIALSKMGDVVLLNITTSMHTDPRTINVNLAGTAAGRYELVENGAGMDGKSGGIYFPDYSSPTNSYTITGGEFNLTRVDTVAGILEGTFSATARSSDGKNVSITDGKIVEGALARAIVDVNAMLN